MKTAWRRGPPLRAFRQIAEQKQSRRRRKQRHITSGRRAALVMHCIKDKTMALSITQIKSIYFKFEVIIDFRSRSD